MYATVRLDSSVIPQLSRNGISAVKTVHPVVNEGRIHSHIPQALNASTTSTLSSSVTHVVDFQSTHKRRGLYTLVDKSLRPASGTARYLSSTNWSPQMNVAPRIRTLVPRCACDSHPQTPQLISGFLRTRSRRPSAPADAIIEGPAWLAHRSCTSISASSFPNFKRSWMSKNNKNGERAKSHMQIFETFRNGTFGCS